MPGFIVHPACGEGANDGKMEKGERHSGCSSGGTASETSLKPSREGQTHPTTAATTRGQYDAKMLMSGITKTVTKYLKTLFNQDLNTIFPVFVKKITKVPVDFY